MCIRNVTNGSPEDFKHCYMNGNSIEMFVCLTKMILSIVIVVQESLNGVYAVNNLNGIH